MVQIARQNTCNCYYHFEKERDPSHNWCYPLARLEAMFNDAGLQIAHSETIRKEMEFDPWVKRMGASAETQTKLREWLINARDAVREFLSPRVEDAKLFFSLTEAIVIGKK